MEYLGCSFSQNKELLFED